MTKFIHYVYRFEKSYHVKLVSAYALSKFGFKIKEPRYTTIGNDDSPRFEAALQSRVKFDNGINFIQVQIN